MRGTGAAAVQQQRQGVKSRPWGGQSRAVARTVPGSTGGWDAISNIANMPPDHAIVLDNWIPRPSYLEIRRGWQNWATGVGSGAVESILVYNGPTSIQQFATGDNGTLYDTSSGGAASATSIIGLSSQRLQWVNFTGVSGSHYLLAANGVDNPIIYDGATWANTAITFSGGSQNSIIEFNAFKGLLFGVISGTTKFIYGTVGQITGAFQVYDLGPLMTRGGYLVASAVWSDTGVNVSQYAIFITSRGQVIVYSGSDPGTTNTWELIANFWVGPPIGQRCFLQIGGDMALISIDGLLPLSQMISTDRAAAARVSFTSNIMNVMNDSARNYSGNFGWQIISYPRGNLAIMNIPLVENQTSYQYVMNTINGSWCRFTGISANVWATMNEIPYFGDNDGNVNQWDVGSGDGDDTITATVETAFNYFGSRGIQKKFNMIKPILTTDQSVTPGVGINVDYGSGGDVSVPDTTMATGAQWDVAQWDQDEWGSEGGTVANWQGVAGIGTCASVITIASTANNGLANGVVLRINAWDMNFEPSPGAGI